MNDAPWAVNNLVLTMLRSMVTLRQAVFGITSNTLRLVRSIIYIDSICGSVRRRPDGLLAGARTAARLDRAPDITAAQERSKSLLGYSDVITHMHTSHAPPPEPNWARIVWRN